MLFTILSRVRVRLALAAALTLILAASAQTALGRQSACHKRRAHAKGCQTLRAARRRHPKHPKRSSGASKVTEKPVTKKPVANKPVTKKPSSPSIGTAALPAAPQPPGIVSAGSAPVSPPTTLPLVVPRFFSSSSVWNAALSSDAPIDPNSGAIVGNLLRQESTESLGLGAYGGPNLYIASSTTPLVHVTLDEHDPALQAAFNAVPIPAGAQPAVGSDAHMAVYQPDTDTMWEFWRLSKQADGWHASWGGRMMHVTTDPGYYRNVDDPAGNILEQAVWGAPATSLPLMAGTMMISELQAGTIPHTIALSITHTCAGSSPPPPNAPTATLQATPPASPRAPISG